MANLSSLKPSLSELSDDGVKAVVMAIRQLRLAPPKWRSAKKPVRKGTKHANRQKRVERTIGAMSQDELMELTKKLEALLSE